MSSAAYTLFHNARVLTPAGGFVPAALLVSRGRIVDVVTPSVEAELGGRDDVDAVNLRRGHVIPGFVDAHFHLKALALKTLRCDLSSACDADDAAASLARFAAGHPGDDAVVGVDFDESTWSSSALPTRLQLDTVDRSRPVFARRVCGHVGVVNSAFLKLLDGPTRSSRFVDEDSGLITEDAVWEANGRSAPAPAAVAFAFTTALAGVHALGITAIHDIVTPGSIDAYLQGLDAARSRLRIDALVVGTLDDLDMVAGRCGGISPDRFRVAGVKLFADGSLGGRTAALQAPYADAPASGRLLAAAGEIAATYRRCLERGVSCAVHAIGDAAVTEAVRAVEGVEGERCMLRLEHAEVLDDDLIDAIASRGIALVMQPNFVRNWGGERGLYRRRLGPERWATTNPFRSLESRGVDVVFGSDGMPPGPLFGLRGATHHPVPGQSIGPVSALRRYTELPVRLPGHERDGGVLVADRPADFTVLSGNPLMADTDTLSVLATVVAGEVVHSAPERHRRG